MLKETHSYINRIYVQIWAPCNLHLKCLGKVSTFLDGHTAQLGLPDTGQIEPLKPALSLFAAAAGASTADIEFWF